eukprot:TRINITY_DN75101_c0_g1_i1.p1 TRINITY_DN75101_c0_g1~~TRINITY_DN75101_c0_g1_i1.p1  ORF type:complete len:418 (-),score=102.36 TRINITY_DN75101_c0_g1_i1:352-1605(-)
MLPFRLALAVWSVSVLPQAEADGKPTYMEMWGKARELHADIHELFETVAADVAPVDATAAAAVRQVPGRWLRLLGLRRGAVGLALDYLWNYYARVPSESLRAMSKDWIWLQGAFVQGTYGQGEAFEVNLTSRRKWYDENGSAFKDTVKELLNRTRHVFHKPGALANMIEDLQLMLEHDSIVEPIFMRSGRMGETIAWFGGKRGQVPVAEQEPDVPYESELSLDTWEQATDGKIVFAKFRAPWCGHCKRLRPHWESLMTKYKGHSDVLVTAVDCTQAGMSLCKKYGVDSYPTLLFGEDGELQVYNGGRELADLERFAKVQLKPRCSARRLELCTTKQKQRIEAYQAMTAEELTAEIDRREARLAEINANFDALRADLQEKYTAALGNFTASKEAMEQSGGLATMQAVLEHRDTAKSEL